jgi:hypothetical protein
MTDDELDQRVREGILSEQVDTSRVAAAVRNQIPARTRHVPGWAVAAAAVIVTALATTFSYETFRKEQTPALCIAAAQDHEREIVKGEPRPWLTQLSAIRSIAEKQGVPASAIAALATTGYSLERGKLCFLNKQIVLHLVYARDGQEISVFLQPRNSDSARGSVREANVGTENTAYFESHRLTAVFVTHYSGAAAFARAGVQVL